MTGFVDEIVGSIDVHPYKLLNKFQLRYVLEDQDQLFRKMDNANKLLMSSMKVL